MINRWSKYHLYGEPRLYGNGETDLITKILHRQCRRHRKNNNHLLPSVKVGGEAKMTASKMAAITKNKIFYWTITDLFLAKMS